MGDNDKPAAEWQRVDKHNYFHNFKCSRCMALVNVPTCMKIPLYNYCPFCGAKMKKEVK